MYISHIHVWVCYTHTWATFFFHTCSDARSAKTYIRSVPRRWSERSDGQWDIATEVCELVCLFQRLTHKLMAPCLKHMNSEQCRAFYLLSCSELCLLLFAPVYAAGQVVFIRSARSSTLSTSVITNVNISLSRVEIRLKQLNHLASKTIITASYYAISDLFENKWIILFNFSWLSRFYWENYDNVQRGRDSTKSFYNFELHRKFRYFLS